MLHEERETLTPHDPVVTAVEDEIVMGVMRTGQTMMKTLAAGRKNILSAYKNRIILRRVEG